MRRVDGGASTLEREYDFGMVTGQKRSYHAQRTGLHVNGYFIQWPTEVPGTCRAIYLRMG